jgi:hypothetical protein
LGAAAPAIWLVLLVGEALTSRHVSGPVALNVLAVSAMALACAFRRRAPIAFLAVVGVLALGLSAGLTSRDFATLTGLYTVTIPVYAVASWVPRQRAVVVLAVFAVVTTAAGLALHASLSGLVGPVLAGTIAAGAGLLARSQRELRHQLELAERTLLDQTRRLEDLAVRQERIAVTERQHALVLEKVGAMLDLAEAATRLMRSGADPSAALAGIEEEGREALTRMRDILGTLRAVPTHDHPDQGSLLAPVTRRSA